MRRAFQFSADLIPREPEWRCAACNAVGRPGEMVGWRARDLIGRLRKKALAENPHDSIAPSIALCSADCEQHAKDHGWIRTLKPKGERAPTAAEELASLMQTVRPYS